MKISGGHRSTYPVDTLKQSLLIVIVENCWDSIVVIDANYMSSH